MAGTISKVLVTGGAGFIGSHIVDRLIDKGFEVGILDNLSTGTRENVHDGSGELKFHNADIREFLEVKEIVKQYDAIVHQAAIVSVKRSIENPNFTNDVNIGGTLNLLKASIDSGIRRFVYASSSSVYGDTETLPKKENMLTQPISPYAVSKLAGENYCKAFARVYGLVTVSLRYFNVYGPRQKYGPYSGVIPTFVKAVMNDKDPIIFGDGLQTRDFTYVSDVVEANCLSLTKTTRLGEVFNIAAGKEVAINDLAHKIIVIFGKSYLKPDHVEKRKGDVSRSYADIAKASEQLGYRPKYDLEEGLRNVVQWFSQKGENF